MKKVVSLVLTVCLIACVMMPAWALADVDLAIQYANQVKELIKEHENDDEVDVYIYLDALNLILKANDEINASIYENYVYVMFGLVSLKNPEETANAITSDTFLSTFDGLFEQSMNVAKENRDMILSEAANAFQKQVYDLSVFELHADYILKLQYAIDHLDSIMLD